MDNGNFRLRTFGEVARETEEEIEENELNINKAIGIDHLTMPIDNFPDPFITCVFMTNDLIYVNLYYNEKCTHHMFVYNHVTRVVTSHMDVKMHSNRRNFPFKCFYSAGDNEIFSFYRQGEVFKVPIRETKMKHNGEKLPDINLSKLSCC